MSGPLIHFDFYIITKLLNLSFWNQRINKITSFGDKNFYCLWQIKIVSSYSLLLTSMFPHPFPSWKRTHKKSKYGGLFAFKIGYKCQRFGSLGDLSLDIQVEIGVMFIIATIFYLLIGKELEKVIRTNISVFLCEGLFSYWKFRKYSNKNKKNKYPMKILFPR